MANVVPQAPASHLSDRCPVSTGADWYYLTLDQHKMLYSTFEADIADAVLGPPVLSW